VKLDEKNKKKTEKANALFAGISGKNEKAKDNSSDSDEPTK
jgi:hypothetical protein